MQTYQNNPKTPKKKHDHYSHAFSCIKYVTNFNLPLPAPHQAMYHICLFSLHHLLQHPDILLHQRLFRCRSLPFSILSSSTCLCSMASSLFIAMSITSRLGSTIPAWPSRSFPHLPAYLKQSSCRICSYSSSHPSRHSRIF